MCNKYYGVTKCEDWRRLKTQRYRRKPFPVWSSRPPPGLIYMKLRKDKELGRGPMQKRDALDPETDDLNTTSLIIARFEGKYHVRFETLDARTERPPSIASY